MGIFDMIGRGLSSMSKKASSHSQIGSGSLRDVQNPTSKLNTPGVYILKMNGEIMKVGGAKIGIQKKMQQYYRLNTTSGLNKYINETNRDQIQVTWQKCPAEKCDELEAKLFDKYGKKAPWAERRPRTNRDTIKLGI